MEVKGADRHWLCTPVIDWPGTGRMGPLSPGARIMRTLQVPGFCSLSLQSSIPGPRQAQTGRPSRGQTQLDTDRIRLWISVRFPSPAATGVLLPSPCRALSRCVGVCAMLCYAISGERALRFCTAGTHESAETSTSLLHSFGMSLSIGDHGNWVSRCFCYKISPAKRSPVMLSTILLFMENLKRKLQTRRQPGGFMFTILRRVRPSDNITGPLPVVWGWVGSAERTGGSPASVCYGRR